MGKKSKFRCSGEVIVPHMSAITLCGRHDGSEFEIGDDSILCSLETRLTWIDFLPSITNIGYRI